MNTYIKPNSQRFATLVHELVDMEEHLHALTGGMLLRGEEATEECTLACAAYDSVKTAISDLHVSVPKAARRRAPVDMSATVRAIKHSERALVLWAKSLTRSSP